MKILNISITEFAGLSRLSFDFVSGFNIFEGENESGKSSILAFIKFMLYGLSRRAAGEDIAERERCLSWSGRRAAGSLLVESNGVLYRVEREAFVQTRGARESYIEDVSIFNADTGAKEETDLSPGELFLGIPEAVFSSTCNITQSGLSGINSGEVGNAIENLLFTANENLNVEKAAGILDKSRKALLYKNERGGLLFDLRTERTTLRNKLGSAVTNARNMTAKEAMAGEYKRQEDEARATLTALETTWEISEITFTLQKFDRLQEDEKKLLALKEELRKLESESYPGGMIPEKALAAELTALSRELGGAELALARAGNEYEKLAVSVTYDREKAATAKALRYGAGGSPEITVDEYQKIKACQKKQKSIRLLLLMLCGTAAAAGAGLIIFSFLIPGIIISAAAIAALCGGIFFSGKAKTIEHNLKDFLLQLGFNSDPGEKKLYTFAANCSSALADEIQYTVALDAREGVVTVSREKLTALQTEANTELVKLCTAEQMAAIDKKVKSKSAADSAETDTGSTDILITALSLAADGIVSFCATRETLARRIANAEGELAALRQYLLKFDEPLLRRRAQNKPEIDPITDEEYKARRAELVTQIRTAEEKRIDIEKQLAVFEATAERPGRLALLLEQNEKQYADAELKYNAVLLASEALAQASSQLRTNVTPKLRCSAGELMGRLTGGKYSEIGIEQDMTLSLSTDGVTRKIDAMSGGTRDAAYISLRLALSSLLCPDEAAPLMIDEGLAQLDESRAANLISILGAWCNDGSGQCLLFTCHSREARLAQDMKLSINHIKL